VGFIGENNILPFRALVYLILTAAGTDAPLQTDISGFNSGGCGNYHKSPSQMERG
jgi:hypothetical protein